MLFPPFGSLLSAVAVVALLMPCHCEALNCWSGAINSSGIESPANVFVIKQCERTDQFCSRGTCISVDEKISLVALSCYNDIAYLIRVGCVKFEALQNEGSEI
ncbi:hypothetical protein niasHT_025155 [Heterodera trifolii]|uniref:Secreted protein n=1 Tax=Heterodera trifolii TaxID=157864 RepID=A0ABD2JLB8_9BILA